MKITLLIIVMALGLFGCALFKKTGRETNVTAQTSTRQLEANRQVLKSADKESRIFTYWNDTGFYQFQHIKEQMDQAEISKLKSKEAHTEKQKNTVRKSDPSYIMVYLLLALVAIGVYVWVKRK